MLWIVHIKLLRLCMYLTNMRHCLSLSLFFFLFPATVQLGTRPPHSWGFWITLRHKYNRQDSSGRVMSSSQKSLPKQHKHKRQTSVLSAGFESAIPAVECLQTYALDYTSSGFGSVCVCVCVCVFVCAGRNYVRTCIINSLQLPLALVRAVAERVDGL